MINNFFKIILRNLWRYRAYAMVNIIGLGIGIAAVVWGFQTYQFSFGFDDFHPERDQVFRGLTSKEGAGEIKGIFPMAAVRAAKYDLAGIGETAVLDERGLSIKTTTGETFAESAHFTNPSFFKLFNFPLIAGSNNLEDPSSVLITEKTARKYFGNENPLGKTMTFYAGETYVMPLTVRGVLKDIPVNSTIQFRFLTNIDNLLKSDGTRIDAEDWSWFVDAAFFRLATPADADALGAAMKRYLPLQNKAREDWKAAGFRLISLRENARLNAVIDSNGLFERPNDAAAYGPLVFALLIFLSACLNFSNTTVARSNTRLKEIGMRKVMGGSQFQLVSQLIMECGIIVVAAILVSAVFNSWWLPAFNQMFTFVHVEADYQHDTRLLVFLVVVFAVTTFLAGAYPAFYISRFNPSNIFRGAVKFGGSNIFSRLMLGLQVAISIITVISGIAFARNADFQRRYDYGYNIDNSFGVWVNDQGTFNAMKNEVAMMPEAEALAGTRNHIGFGYKRVVGEAEGIKREINYLEVGQDYLSTMQLRKADGRMFDPALESDFTSAVMVSENMAAVYGWKGGEALGKQIQIDTSSYTIAGILKDFNSDDLFDPVEPVLVKLGREDRFQFLVVRAKPGELVQLFGKVKASWEKLFPLKPFNGFYQNEIKAESYKVTTSIAKIFSWFALVSILLTATGLFALVSLTMLKKMREIALRRVVGATPGNILVMVNKGYFWIFMVSAAVGCYGGWMLSGVLLNMIFKVNAGIQQSTLVGSVVVLFVLGSLTTGVKVWQAIRTNPVKLLKAQ